MKAKSAIEKGKRFENYLEDFLIKNIDINTRRVRGSGSGVNKGDIYLPKKNLLIEAKNQYNLKIIEWWEKIKNQCYDEIPVLMVRNPKLSEFKETLVVISLEDLKELIK